MEVCTYTFRCTHLAELRLRHVVDQRAYAQAARDQACHRSEEVHGDDDEHDLNKGSGMYHMASSVMCDNAPVDNGCR